MKAVGSRISMLFARITLPSFFAALPLLVLAVVYAFQLRPAEELGRGMMYELILVHAFPFLGAAALARPKKWFGHLVRWVCFWGLFSLYLGVAYDADGWWGIAILLGLGLATYCGLFVVRDSTALLQRVGTRWIVALLTTFGVGIVRGLWIGVFGGTADVMKDPGFGMLFFLTLGVCELVRAYDLLQPRKMRKPRKPRKSRKPRKGRKHPSIPAAP